MTEKQIDFINDCASDIEIPFYGVYNRSEIIPLLIKNNQGGWAEVELFINNGFISPSYHQNFVNFELTERWRKLKNCGNYELLLLFEKNEELLKSEKLDLEYKLLVSQNEFQKINNDFIDAQKGLISSQVTTNTHTRESNDRMKLILIVTASIYFVQLIVSVFGTIYSKNDSSSTMLIKQQDSLTKTMGIRLYQLEIQNNALHDKIDSLNSVLVLKQGKPLKK